jgi:hypothetical protein
VTLQQVSLAVAVVEVSAVLAIHVDPLLATLLAHHLRQKTIDGLEEIVVALQSFFGRPFYDHLLLGNGVVGAATKTTLPPLASLHSLSPCFRHCRNAAIANHHHSDSKKGLMVFSFLGLQDTLFFVD